MEDISKETTNPPKSNESKSSWRSFANRLTSIWSRERKENEPEIKVKIFFSSHVSKQDAEAFIQDFEKCDIFVPELPDYTPDSEASFNLLSQGKIGRREFRQYVTSAFPEYYFAERDIIFKSKKPILLIDVPHGHPLIKQEEQVRQRHKTMLGISENFDELYEAEKDFVSEGAKLAKERDQFISTSFAGRIKLFLKDNPDYRAEKELSVLIFLGSAHTPVFHYLKEKNESGMKVERAFNDLPIFFSSSTVAERTINFGKELSRDLIAQSALESLLYSLYKSGTIQTPKTQRQVYNELSLFLQSLKYEEIKILVDGWLQGKRNLKSMRNRLFSLCTSKGLELPDFLK